MKKYSRLVLIGTALAIFFGLQVLAEKLGGAIFFYVGIALFVAFTKRLRDARKVPEGSQKGPLPGSASKSVSVVDESQIQQSSA